MDTSDIEKVKDAMISDFSIDDALLASSLMQTKEWKLEENKANAISENQFEQMQIQQQASKISEYLSKIYGRTISFEIKFVPKKVEEKKQEIPTEVKILRDVFKGTITVGA